ncbi:MAG: hypothetical protein U9Q77_09710 [Candidatus Marinimicrobia bacterium]|nr:hypothetical protein [Candidatus Neomarinimicrobiota bacterium]
MKSDLSQSELNLYIRYCASLSTAYLFSRRKAGKLGSEYDRADEAKMQQLALDSIAELFARDDKGIFYKLIQYFEPLQDQIKADEDEALFMTRRLVVAHTKQSLARAFQQNDPSGARIYRNLSLVHKRDPEIKLAKHWDEDYFYLQNESGKTVFPDDFNPSKPEIVWDNALFMLENSRKDHDTLPGIVRDFLSELKQEDDHRHFISRSDLYKLLKYLMGLKTLSFETEYAGSTLENSENYEISQTDQEVYTDRIKTFFRYEINQRFVEKSKIDQNEANIYTEILDQYFEDLLMDGYAGKLPEYKVNSGFSEMKSAIWKIHRGRLEYLIKLGKKELQHQYEHDFPNTEPMRIEDQ